MFVSTLWRVLFLYPFVSKIVLPHFYPFLPLITLPLFVSFRVLKIVSRIFDTNLPRMIPVAIFARVSTELQDNSRQISDLQAVADRNNWKVIATITAKISGYRKSRKERKDLDQLIELAQAKKIKKVLITEVSRLGRRPAETYSLLEELTEHGVSIYSHNYGLETLQPNGKRNPAASLIFMIFSEQARTEIELLSERIRSGQQEAKRNGKHIARPKGSVKTKEKLFSDYPKIVKYLKEGNNSIREIAKLCDVANNTVMKVKKALQVVQ